MAFSDPPSSQNSLHRRQFLKGSLASAAALAIPAWAQGTSYKAAVIGHTGKGDYGMGVDRIFRGQSAIQVVAVADPETSGHDEAKNQTGAPVAYADYREMLSKEQPQLVALASNQVAGRLPMAMAVLDAGAHLFLQTPMATSLEEADQLLAKAEEQGLRICVSQPLILDPKVQQLKTSLDQGQLGDLLEIRAFGMQDETAGSEDMLRWGTHLFDLARFLVGDCAWCSARIQQEGTEISAAAAAATSLGPLMGDQVHAHYALRGGANLTFLSQAKQRQISGDWGLELIGSKAKVRLFAGFPTKVFWVTAAKVKNYTYPYVPLPTGDAEDEAAALPEGAWLDLANRRIVEDWLRAIQGSRDPISSGYRGMKSLEMAMAALQSSVEKRRVRFPLHERGNPLAS